MEIYRVLSQRSSTKEELEEIIFPSLVNPVLMVRILPHFESRIVIAAAMPVFTTTYSKDFRLGLS